MTSFFSKNPFNPQPPPVPQKPTTPPLKPEQKQYFTRPEVNKELKKYTLGLGSKEKAKIIPWKYGRDITKTDIRRAERDLARSASKSETTEQHQLFDKEKRILKKIERKLKYP